MLCRGSMSTGDEEVLNWLYPTPPEEANKDKFYKGLRTMIRS